MNLIEILPNIYGVKVPMDDKKYYISGFSYLCRRNEISNRNREIVIDEQLIDFKILGYVTATEISFDASDVVESQDFADMDYDGNYIEVKRYWDYEYKQFGCMDSDESFRSALPKEIYFEHPQGKLDYCCNGRDCGCLGFPVNIVSKGHWKEYQEIEQNITQKLLILKKL